MSAATLSATDRARLKAALEARRATLVAEAGAQLKGSGDTRVVGLAHRLEENDDWAVADALAELDIAEVRHLVRELSDVDAALARFRDGGYGECVDCGVAIAPARLTAYPTARRCIPCQEAWERKTAGPPATAV
jgi:DnaK suppressor protein